MPMTEKQMLIIASRKMFMHWVKLYFPHIIKDWKPIKTDEEAHDEKRAFWNLCAYMDKPGSKGLRLYTLIQTIDVRETRQLYLGETVPVSLEEEAALVFKETECLFEQCKKNKSAFSGMTPACVPW
jgi:hypothetical protein